jgi:uncharacterized hydrophobic protein (TIGR00271 family)
MTRRRFRVSPERYGIVLREISEGSEPEVRFYIMVAVSTMIASFGLITNSTAVIIGAMLVAPLMTPIFGIALALIRSDAELFGKALKAEIAGVAAAILMGVLLGLLYPALEPTPEMIARTEPQLFDLLVAVFSGFAGAYALMDEKISPALPGVAIATAIVPPLANAGLCFSVGQYFAGVGSFLLFFANFLSILLVAAAAFWFFGMSGRFGQVDKKTMIKRFSLPVFCFVFVSVFLTHTLIKIAQNHSLNKTIQTTLARELLDYPDTTLDSAQYDKEDDVIYVMADVHSSATLTPTQVSRLQTSLQKEIGMPAQLIVRSKIAREISALGSNLILRKPKLDGSFVAKDMNPRVRDAKIADTIIRNYFAELVGYKLDNVRVYQIAGTPTVVASIYGIATPNPKGIEEMETRLRQALDNPAVRLVISFIETELYDRAGPIRLEFTGLVALSKEQAQVAKKAVDVIRNDLAAGGDTVISGINYNLIDGTLNILVETSGARVLSTEEVRKIEANAAEKAGLSVELFVYMQAKTVVTSSGYQTYPAVARKVVQKLLPATKDAVREIIEASNY